MHHLKKIHQQIFYKEFTCYQCWETGVEYASIIETGMTERSFI